MTSATLAVGRPDLAYFRERIGATEAEPLQLGSPFDFQKQMKIFVVQKMPDPRDAGYTKRLSIGSLISSKKLTAARLFCLRVIATCSKSQVRCRNFSANDMNLFVQGGGAPRTKLLEQFKSTPRKCALRDR